jgi:hypothetical protein
MRSEKLLWLVLFSVIATISCDRYSKACFVGFLMKNGLLDKNFAAYTDGKVDHKCEVAINETITQIRSASSDACVCDFFKKKLVSETLLREYLLPQLKSPQKEVRFDDRFTSFKNKAVNLSTVICNNKDVFRPDLKTMMRSGRLKTESKSREIVCLQAYITNKNQPLTEECSHIVNAIKTEFYKSMESDMKRVFSPPNDKLLDLKCSEEKALKTKLFEKIFFFVVLAATKNMNDNQIDVLLKSAEGVIAVSTKLLFECML